MVCKVGWCYTTIFETQYFIHELWDFEVKPCLLCCLVIRLLLSAGFVRGFETGQVFYLRIYETVTTQRQNSFSDSNFTSAAPLRIVSLKPGRGRDPQSLDMSPLTPAFPVRASILQKTLSVITTVSLFSRPLLENCIAYP